jgi:hypothetical protein
MAYGTYNFKQDVHKHFFHTTGTTTATYISSVSHYAQYFDSLLNLSIHTLMFLWTALPITRPPPLYRKLWCNLLHFSHLASAWFTQNTLLMIWIHKHLLLVNIKNITAYIPNCINCDLHVTSYSTHYVLWSHVVITLIQLLMKYVTWEERFTVTFNHNTFLFWFNFFCILSMCSSFLLSKISYIITASSSQTKHLHGWQCLSVHLYSKYKNPIPVVLKLQVMGTGHWVLYVLAKSFSFYFR